MILTTILLYIFISIGTGFGYYSYMDEYDDYTEDAMITGAVICGLFWPIFYLTRIVRKILIKLR